MTPRCHRLWIVAAIAPLATACAWLPPTPAMSVAWYTVADFQSDRPPASATPPASVAPAASAASAASPAAAKEVRRTLLALLNQGAVPMRLSNVIVNPGWSKDGQRLLSWALPQAGQGPILNPGQMLLLELQRDTTAAPLDATAAPQFPEPKPQPWICAVPTRVQVDIEFLSPFLRREINRTGVILDIPSPLPTALPYDWMNCPETWVARAVQPASP